MVQGSLAGFTIAFEPNASTNDLDVLYSGLSAYNQRVLGSERHEPIRLLVRDEEGEVVAGLIGELYFNLLYMAIYATFSRKHCQTR